MSLSVKEFWKSVNIWGSYGQEFSVLFFWDTVYMYQQHASVIMPVDFYSCSMKMTLVKPNLDTATATDMTLLQLLKWDLINFKYSQLLWSDWRKTAGVLLLEHPADQTLLSADTAVGDRLEQTTLTTATALRSERRRNSQFSFLLTPAQSYDTHSFIHCLVYD